MATNDALKPSEYNGSRMRPDGSVTGRARVIHPMSRLIGSVAASTSNSE